MEIHSVGQSNRDHKPLLRTPHQPHSTKARREPLAIVGVGCRFPGNANGPAAFWGLLRDGVDAIEDIPPNRWSIDRYFHPEPGVPGKTNSRWGGFINDLEGFDADFFRISPREASAMDPQQRHLLEVTWEALEDAGVDVNRFRGSAGGVFIGMSSLDYAFLEQGFGEIDRIDTYANTGGAMSIASNRISFSLDWRGPSVSVDTACSSSLVAIHLACESLQNDECPLVVAGGVNVLVKPEPYIGFSQLHMLAPDGRCKAFDASADGFVRSEGVGIIVLKRLSDAVRDGDSIYALILGTAVNQDGHTSGLTVPSRLSQEELIRETCRRAGVSTAEIQYVEAHGTGTVVGDPIEAGALGNVLSQSRSDGDVCAIGSVKSNIGHLEPAAGVAGLIKVALALKHGMIPPSLHYHTPNPEIPFDELKLRVPVSAEPWLPKNGRALAGVNSFGFGGTNAHAVLASAPSSKTSDRTTADHSASGAPPAARSSESGEAAGAVEASEGPTTGEALLFPVSARSPKALRELAESYRRCLSSDGSGAEFGSFHDLCCTAALRRTHHDHRLAFVARSTPELIDGLDLFLETGEAHAGCAMGRLVSGQRPKVAFVFSGQGPQWWSMGSELFQSEPVFRQRIEECDELIRQWGPWSLVEELNRDESSSRINDTAIAQPAIFAIQVALSRLWQTWGIEPDVVVGHSVGEVAAAYVAGALSLEDAARVIFERGRCMATVPTGGRMLAVGLPAAEAEALINGTEDRVHVAVVNSPNSVTLAGDADALQELAAELESQQVFQKFLRVDYAFHSPQMDPIREELLASLREIEPRAPGLVLYSTVTGQPADRSDFASADYWWQNVRRPVQFAQAVQGLLKEEGPNLFLELAPHPVLSSSVSEILNKNSAKATVAHSLRRGHDERETMLKNLASLYAAGCAIAWDEIVPTDGRYARLPTYRWQHERFWRESDESKEQRTAPAPHPLLGIPLNCVRPTRESRLYRQLPAFLNDHRVQEHVLLSGTSYIEMAVAAAREQFGPGAYSVEDLELLKACFLPEEGATRVQVSLDPSDGTFAVCSKAAQGAQTWNEHVRGKVRLDEDGLQPQKQDVAAIQSRCTRQLAGEACYDRLRRLGLDYGPAFRGMQHLWLAADEGIGRINAPSEIESELERYHLHPALLDACFQVGFAFLPAEEESVYLPVEIEHVRVFGRLPAKIWCHIFRIRRFGAEFAADANILDDGGRVLAQIRGFRARRIEGARDGQSAENLEEISYGYEWRLQPRPDQKRPQRHADFLPPLDALGRNTAADARELDARMGAIAANLETERAFEPVCAGFILKAFSELGLTLSPGMRATSSELIQQMAIGERYHRLLERYLTILEEDGILRKIGSEWVVESVPDFDDIENQWRELLKGRPAYAAEATLLGRCGRKLDAVLNGDADPLHLIFPDGSMAITDHLYQDSPFLRFHNLLAQRTFQRILADLPEGRTVRILEIGAGTGGMTSYIVPILPPDRTEYVYTDLSNTFFLKAEEKFRDYPFIQYQRLDIEQDPGEQGFDPHSFDIVFAAEVLHATRDLRETLEHVKWLLASDGMLVLLEGCRLARWVDLVFALTEGWWRFSDTDIRSASPLLAYQQWDELLGSLGFAAVCEASGMENVDNALILARGPRLEESELTAAVRTDAQAEAQTAEAEAGPGPQGASESGNGAQRQAPSAPTTSSSGDATDAGDWIIFSDRGGHGQRLAEELRSCGGTCVLVFEEDEYARHEAGRFGINARNPEHMHQLCTELFAADQPQYQGIVHFWNCDVPAFDQPDPSGVETALLSGNFSLVSLVQALSGLQTDQQPRLWIVTCGAQSVGREPQSTSALQAGAWGMSRVIVNEMPKLRATTVDLSSGVTDEEIASLCRELFLDDVEDEIALRGGARFVHRFVHLFDADSDYQQELRRTRTSHFRLEPSRNHTLDDLSFRETKPSELGPEEVEIHVAAAALNFSDVMKVLGIYPGLGDGPVPLGIECAGTISRVGEDVRNVRPGDEVAAIAPFSFGSYTTTAAALVAHKPSHLTFEEAATIPIAFLTAHYSLNHVGRMAEGERVLIHAATGGVGLAAIQLAERAGAVVFATAGTPEKRELLDSLGISHVMDSRRLAFAEEILEATGGEGIDLVLNSLAGAAIDKGLSVLRDGGRFLEIGKRDIYQHSRMGLRPFRKNLSFAAIDLDCGLRERWSVFSRLFQELMQEFHNGHLRPLPHRVFPASNMVGAFRYLAQAKHIGKVVVSFEGQELSVVPSLDGDIRFRDDATYLITGGLGGFGLTVANWMVNHGARHLLLMGRRGIHNEEAQQSVDAMRAAGAEVVVASVDVCDRPQVEEVLAGIRAKMPPLRGVMHAAMVLRDTLLANMTEEQMREVWGPKVLGARNVYTQIDRDDLDFFLLFSSVASVVGTGGQGNYASANAVLDSLAYDCRSRGVPALSVSWGYLGEVGFVARHSEFGKRFEAIGVSSFSPQEAVKLLARFLQSNPSHAGVMRVNWGILEQNAVQRALSPRFAGLTPETSEDGDGADSRTGAAMRAALLEASPAERLEMIESLLRKQVARVLGMSPSKLDVEKPLTDLGLDSLMAVELRNWIEGDLRLNLPIVELVRGPSVLQLAEIMARQLAGDEPASAEPPLTESQEPALQPAHSGNGLDNTDAEALIEQVDDMSESEVDALLGELAAEDRPNTASDTA